MLKIIMRALRLPFIFASVLPFIYGSLIHRSGFRPLAFMLGLISAGSLHLSANLMNDYADSKSGVDWKDKDFYGFFGGSKLIQEGKLSERFYFSLSFFFGLVSLISVIFLTAILKKPQTLILYAAIVFLGWSYSLKPLQFSYRRIGEAIIFLLFGPALVMGGYFIQTGIFPDLKSFTLSLPFGFFTTAILFANEVPDYNEDEKSRKFTWVSLVGRKRAFILYAAITCLGFAAIVSGFILGYIGALALLSLIFIFPLSRAAGILKRFPEEKLKLIESSRLTIQSETFIGIILIASTLL